MIRQVMFRYPVMGAGFRVEHVDIDIKYYGDIKMHIKELWLKNHPDIKFFFTAVFVRQPNRIFAMIKDCFQE